MKTALTLYVLSAEGMALIAIAERQLVKQYLAVLFLGCLL